MAAALMTFAHALETEPQVIARCLRRRDAVFVGRLVEQFHYRLLRYLVYLTARREQAEDLVQDTWIRVLERGPQYDGRSRFEPWLFSIARNLAIDEMRRWQRVEPGEPAERAAPETYSPFVAAARSEDAVRIAAALAGLEPFYREALVLRFQEELSLEEIAQVTRSPVSTVASRIHRGLAQLRAHLGGGDHAK